MIFGAWSKGVTYIQRRFGKIKCGQEPGSLKISTSPAVFGKTLQLRTHKVFLQFLYPEGVYFKYQVKAPRAPLGNLHN